MRARGNQAIPARVNTGSHTPKLICKSALLSRTFSYRTVAPFLCSGTLAPGTFPSFLPEIIHDMFKKTQHLQLLLAYSL